MATIGFIFELDNIISDTTAITLGLFSGLILLCLFAYFFYKSEPLCFFIAP